MRLGALRRQCERLIEDLDLPSPLDPDRLCEHLAARRGRPVRLLPMALPASGASGFWVSMDANDYVIYDSATVGPHRLHIILHELAHMVLDHGSPVVELSQGLLPHLEPALVRRLMRRTYYDVDEESEAEMVASLLQETMGQWTPTTVSEPLPREAAALVERFQRTMDNPPWR
jgi:hypothetical protein